MGSILFAENSRSSLEMIRSFELCWNDREEVYFGSELPQNVLECLTRGAHRVQSMGHLSQSAYDRDVHRTLPRGPCLSEAFTSVMCSKTVPLPVEWAETYVIVLGT